MLTIQGIIKIGGIFFLGTAIALKIAGGINEPGSRKKTEFRIAFL